MKKLLPCIMAIFILFSVSYADEALIVPHTFELRTPARAEEVNENFEAIEDIINQNLIVMYDYGPPADSRKIFTLTSGSVTTINVNTDSATGIETWEYLDGSRVEHLKMDHVDGTLEIGRREYNTSGILVRDLTYFPAVIGVDLAEPKEIGRVWGNAYVLKKPDGSMYGTEVNMYSIIGIEDITVPAGTFVNCAKIFHAIGAYRSATWYAEGVGMVKRIGVDGLMELQGFTQ